MRTYIDQLCDDYGCLLEDPPIITQGRNGRRKRVMDIRASTTRCYRKHTRMTGDAWEVTPDRTRLMALMSCQDSGCHCISICKVCCHCCYKGINIDGEHLSHLISADDTFLVAKSPEELESMLSDIHIASKPVGLSMNLSKTKVMLNENAITSTVALDGNTIER